MSTPASAAPTGRSTPPLGPARTVGLLLGATLFVLAGDLFATGLVNRGPGQLVGLSTWLGFGLGYLTIWPMLYLALVPDSPREALPFESVLAAAAGCALLGSTLSDARTGPWPLPAAVLALAVAATAARRTRLRLRPTRA
ncbi:hypothetical protein AB0K51_17370 [Kitasatospora sp. NPDC049285]|uniref:hypothetical protein n=1 Tax=Kitasatospora sp. NPDC049285 TaxID=3157096 RepID=UPI0034184CFE